MRYYFAGAYARKVELAGYARALEDSAIDAVVTSRWLTYEAGNDDSGFSAGELVTPAAIEKAWWYGQRDIEDLSDSHAAVSFTGEGVRGGRHIEHGVAISYYDNHPWDLSKRTEPMRLIIVGPREHVFHCHPATEQHASWTAFLAHEIQQYREGPQDERTRE
jgi:hypothetical protein